jgi:hypothetical protein
VVTKYHDGDQINKNDFGLGKWHVWETRETGFGGEKWCRWEDNMDGMEWIDMLQGRNRWQAVVNVRNYMTS